MKFAKLTLGALGTGVGLAGLAVLVAAKTVAAGFDRFAKGG